MLLTEIKYFNVMLPRIPTKIAREIEVKIMLLDQAAERAVANLRVAHRFKKGAKVRALFSEDDTVRGALVEWVFARVCAVCVRDPGG